jgi:dTDP-4-dehydrorhamnose 3,5-epimerase-like enzyme
MRNQVHATPDFLQHGDAVRSGPGPTTVSDCKILALPTVRDQRGSLTFIEAGRPVPFVIRRAYWIYDVPGGEVRGGHAYRRLQEVLVSLSGSFDVVLDDGRTSRVYTLNRSFCGLYVPPMIWRRIENVSTNAVCLILASLPYDPADYVRDYGRFVRCKEQGPAHEHG